VTGPLHSPPFPSPSPLDGGFPPSIFFSFLLAVLRLIGPLVTNLWPHAVLSPLGTDILSSEVHLLFLFGLFFWWLCQLLSIRKSLLPFCPTKTLPPVHNLTVLCWQHMEGFFVPPYPFLSFFDGSLFSTFMFLQSSLFTFLPAALFHCFLRPPVVPR